MTNEFVEPTVDALPSMTAGSTQTAQPDVASESRSADPAASAWRQTPREKSRTRTPRTYPASSFMEALPLAEAIQRFAAGQRIRRLTLFDNLKKSADSGPSKQLVTNSAQYGLTKGSYTAEYLELTPEGRTASSDESVGKPRMAARLQLAIARVAPFNSLYEQFKGNRLPALAVLRDFATEQGTSPDNADECVQTFMANARDLELIRTYAGAERLLTFEMVLDEVEPGNQLVEVGVKRYRRAAANSTSTPNYFPSR